MNKRLIYALPATVLALVALSLAIVGLVSSKNQPESSRQTSAEELEKAPPTPEYRYLVAREALSPGDVMTEEGFRSVTSSDPLPDAIPEDDAPYGQAIKTSLAAGQMLTSANMRTDSVLETLVPQGYQAMAIAVDDVSGVGGLLRPGDRVDVTASFRRSDKDKPAAMKLLDNVLVLAVKGVPYTGEADEENDSRRNNTVVLSVPEDKVPRLLLASSEGKLQLVAISSQQVATSEPVSAPKGEEPEVKPVYLEDLFPAPPEPEPTRRATPPPSTRVQVFEGSESRSVYVR